MASPSRSEKMLRDVLRDVPPSPTPKTQRRHSHPVSLSLQRGEPESDAALSPHEQVLRCRLERVLSERSHSRNSSRSHSQDAASSGSLPFTPPATPPREQPSPTLSTSSTESASPTPPLLPPSPSAAPSHKFNARTASQQCRLIDGYVSFSSVEGLGMPPDPPEEVKQEPDGSWRRVLRWVS
ncbi:hypothetical protein CYLTODRAFT_459045 [Cylindrobasidium torrendii FP15055 ss-10]|uniref:Uncharacterized protein n=1 Tax=Cylindrobasidium torrendii FP15055 ss-10 TaxID=1314674 RepID=A0A0D7AYM6_9AGAR|nr:hypothetical protein CYLTODRAFT_459045 [Cylindrobasidium torrendii FP15055 ss-10]